MLVTWDLVPSLEPSSKMLLKA
ncbi:unnamed protein product [Linum tenue]|uniref:Uncharacterized protein n=1 Tax=Linum tenue TaxID=586396 RepID=A0AAV0RR64_9ROSI|nr:unnamed protein product [Linum tenue]